MKEPWLYPDMVLSQINLLHYGPEAYLEPLNRMQVRRIWIWQTREKVFFPDPAYFETVKRHIEYFHANGFEVGVWTTSLGFGEELTTEAMRQRTKNMTRLRSIRGKDCKGDAICPTDEDFCRTYQAWIRALAALKPDLLMLDDEHCLSIRPGIGCFCDRHMQLLSDALGEELVLDELPERIFTGGQNRYRDAWYQVMGDTLREFFGKVRAAADEVDPDLRIGICGGYTSWDFEGLDLIEMAKILAGKTSPSSVSPARPIGSRPCATVSTDRSSAP